MLNSINKFLSDFFVKAIMFIEKLNRKYSIQEPEDFYQVNDFAWVEKVEACFPEIQKEFNYVLEKRQNLTLLREVFPEQQYLSNDSLWKIFILLAVSQKVEENAELCPVTIKALSEIPGACTAFFSILEPNKEIPIHRGFYNGFLRYHLALKIPDESKCAILVGDTQRHWQEGKSLIFDDTNLHYAWNHSDEVRAVLFVDFYRPLKFPFNILNYFIIELLKFSPQFHRFKEKARTNSFAK